MNIKFDSKLMNFILLIIESLFLNIVFMICCLPIFTIGAAVTALYSVSFKRVDNREGYLWREFFRAFKRNFRISIMGFLFYLVVICFLLFQLLFWYSLDSVFSLGIMILMGLILLFVICSSFYFFPFAAQSHLPFRILLKNSIGFMLLYKKNTLLLLMIHLGFLFGEFNSRPFRIFVLLIGYSFITYLCAWLLNKCRKDREGIENSCLRY